MRDSRRTDQLCRHTNLLSATSAPVVCPLAGALGALLRGHPKQRSFYPA
jgi:hypothetical protein